MSSDSFERRYRASATLPRLIEQRDFGWANILSTLLEELPPTGRFLDVGSGTGVVCHFVATRGLAATGIERSEAGIALSRAQAERLAIRCATFIQWDLDVNDDLPVASDYDVAFASEILEHVTSDLATLRRIRKCMRPGARLIATSPSVGAPMHRNRMRRYGFDELDERRCHRRRYSEESFRLLASRAGFEEITVRPIAGVVRDFFFSSRPGLALSRFIKRPLTPGVQALDRLTIRLADSQLLLLARAPDIPTGPAD